MFKPMLSAKFDWEDPEVAIKQMQTLRYPVLCSPKIDGIRAHIKRGQVLSRKNKLIPNYLVQNLFGLTDLEDIDGELVVGEPNVHDCFNRTTSGVMSRDGQPNVKYYIFDVLDERPFFQRCLLASSRIIGHFRTHPVSHRMITNYSSLLEYEESMLNQGYEGIMIRDPNGPYKQGRSTLREGWLTKLKRFSDSEAEILGCYEQETNNNIAIINEVGNMKRSSHKENKVGNGLMGGFFVKDLKTGVEFNVGNFEGITNSSRVHMWSDFLVDPTEILGRVIKYKYLEVGMKDKPRHPKFVGFRED